MKNNTQFWSYLAHFFLEWEMFQKEVVEKIKTSILCLISVLRYHGREGKEDVQEKGGSKEYKQPWQQEI